jgi:hypothetical protein
MNIGFTGTSTAMTVAQLLSLHDELTAQYVFGDEFHHGDCVGADNQAHDIAKVIGYFMVIHPPTDGKKRSFRWGNILRPKKPYLERNHDIVDECQMLIAAPRLMTEEQRSGTWATVRYARKMDKPRTIILPDGRIYGE